MKCHLYSRKYQLFNYKYVHIVIPIVHHLNRDFFYVYKSHSSTGNWQDASYTKCLEIISTNYANSNH